MKINSSKIKRLAMAITLTLLFSCEKDVLETDQFAEIEDKAVALRTKAIDILKIGKVKTTDIQTKKSRARVYAILSGLGNAGNPRIKVVELNYIQKENVFNFPNGQRGGGRGLIEWRDFKDGLVNVDLYEKDKRTINGRAFYKILIRDIKQELKNKRIIDRQISAKQQMLAISRSVRSTVADKDFARGARNDNPIDYFLVDQKLGKGSPKRFLLKGRRGRTDAEFINGLGRITNDDEIPVFRP